MKSQQVWNSYASSYDAVLPLLSFYQEARDRHIEAMSVFGIDDVLDIGAGTGNVAIPLAEKGARVTAIDLNGMMLGKLREKISNSFADNIIVVEQNSEHLPQMEDASFDGVTVLLALYGMEFPDKAINEAVRLLRPGGTIILTEPKRSFRLQSLLDRGEEELRAQGVFEELQADWGRVYKANEEKNPTLVEGRVSAEDAEIILRAEDFTDVKSRDSHLGYCATVWGVKPKG